MTNASISLRSFLPICVSGFVLTFANAIHAQPQPARTATPSIQVNSADLTPTATVNPNQSIVEQIIHQGSQLESAEKWDKAYVHYEQASKDYPQERKIQRRLQNARIHFDLQRRYLDSNYVSSVQKTDQRTALETLAELLLKIDSYHVDTPNWLGFARRGMGNLDVALFDPAFQKTHLHAVSYEALHKAQLTLHQKLDSRTIRNRQDLYSFAAAAAQILREELRLPEQVVVYEFISGTVGTLDPYSAYLTADQYKEVMNHIEGNFVGLGVEVRPAKQSLEIVDTIKGGPANKGGILPGDQVIAIDHKKVLDIGGNVAADMLRGLENSLVVIDLKRQNGELAQVTLRRSRVDIPSVESARIVDSQLGIAFIKLVNFQKTTKRDFDAALWKLHAAGMKSLILDLRGNPGGLLTASVDLADRFVSSGVIVSTRGRNPQEDYIHRAHTEGTWGVPLTILIDGNSASASEILAGAIHDHHRGTVIGQRSYGKGSVQGIFPLSYSKGGVRLTTAKFYSPLGTAISHRGVTPHVVVNVTKRVAAESNVAQDRDETLLTAIRIAAQKLTTQK